MKLSVILLATATLASGSSWFGNAARTAYNKWHQTELERWLSDHNIPYPTPADRKDLENLVKDNWEDYVVKPYNKWDTNQLQNYIQSKGKQAKKGTEKDAKSLAAQVQEYWHETAEEANEAYNSVQDWFFDTWTESQLKSFLDHNGIPNPSPRTRDSLLHTVRSNYQSAANKVGETFNYPGDWLFSSWSESDLKGWLDERGIPVPQPTNRDKLIASIRRNARSASREASSAAASASSSARAAQGHITEQLLDTWNENQLKAWLDKQGIKVPQGSKRNELVALVRKNAAHLTGSPVGAATSSAGNYYAQVTNQAYSQARQYYDLLLNQIGLASKEARASLSSASSVASVEASKKSVEASKSAVSASKQASKNAADATKSAKSSASSAKKEL